MASVFVPERMPGALRPRSPLALRTIVVSPYDDRDYTAGLKKQDAKVVDGSISEIKHYLKSGLGGGLDYDDLMEHFEVMAIMSMDTNSTIIDLASGRSDIAGYSPVPYNQSLSEYSSYLQDQLESEFPEVANMTQAEFEALITAALVERYDDAGLPYWTAEIDLPVPLGYTSVTVRISPV